MAGRKILDAQDARNCLSGAARAGVHRAEWARAQGVDPRSLNAWRINLERGVCTPKSMPRLVELVRQVAPSVVSVRCGPFTVEVGDNFDDQLLARVLGVVAAC